MNPDGGFPRVGTPGWHRSNAVDASFSNVRSQSTSFTRFPPPGLAPLNPSTSNTQVPYLSSGNYTSGDGHSFSTEVALPFSTAVGHSYPSAGGHSFSSGGGHTFSSGGGHTFPSGGGHTFSSGGGHAFSSGGGHTFSSGGGHTFSSGGGHTFPSGGGHAFTNQAHNSSYTTFISPYKCPDCYSMGSELFYCKTQYDIMTNKVKAELQQHALCGPKFLSFELKLEEHKKCEPKIQMLEKELNEARGSRERCKKLENELELLRDKCRIFEEELHDVKNPHMSKNVYPKQDPDAMVAVEEEKPRYNPHLQHIFNVNRKSQDPRNESSRYHQNDGRQNGKFSRGARYPHDETPQEAAKYVRSRVAVREMEGDLLDMPQEYSLAHCVGSDFIMSSGVAIRFRKMFRRIPDLLDQNKGPGEVAFLTHNGRQIYYLVTKESSTGKPTFENFCKAVRELRQLCEEQGVTKLAIPKIGCGRDQLDWNDVKRLLNDEFSSTSIDITVCVIHQENLPDKRWNLKLIQTQQPLTDLNPIECAFVFIASKDGFLTPAIKNLTQKYNFSSDFASQPKSLGGLYHFSARGGDVNIFGLIVKERNSDPFSFCKFSECLLSLRRAMRKLHLYYIGFEAFDDPHIPCVTRKIWTTLIDCFFTDDYEIHICWPNNIKEKPWEERK